MKSHTHAHITKEVERIGQRHGLDHPHIFAAHLTDGTFLPCLHAEPEEQYLLDGCRVDMTSLGYAASAYCIVHGDCLASVQPSPFFLPQWLYDRLVGTRYRDEYFALRIRMKDGKEFTLKEGLGMDCYRPPDGYSWDDVAETGSGYDNEGTNLIFPMVVFHCLLTGLSYAKRPGAEPSGTADAGSAQQCAIGTSVVPRR